MKCKRCGKKLVLASYSNWLEFVPDSEPYESGIEEEVDFEIVDEVGIGVEFCPEHGVQNAWVVGFEQPEVKFCTRLERSLAIESPAGATLAQRQTRILEAVQTLGEKDRMEGV